MNRHPARPASVYRSSSLTEDRTLLALRFRQVGFWMRWKERFERRRERVSPAQPDRRITR